MSNLVLELRQGERLIINGAEIRVRNNVRLELLTQAKFMFGKQIMEEEEATTPARKIYFALQKAYVGETGNREENRQQAYLLISQFAVSHPPAKKVLGRISAYAGRNEYYNALKLTRNLMKYEDGRSASPDAVAETPSARVGYRKSTAASPA